MVDYSVTQIKEIQMNIEEIDDIIMQYKLYKEKMSVSYNGNEFFAIESAVDNICKRLYSLKENLKNVSQDIDAVSKDLEEKRIQEEKEQEEKQRAEEEQRKQEENSQFGEQDNNKKNSEELIKDSSDIDKKKVNKYFFSLRN